MKIEKTLITGTLASKSHINYHYSCFDSEILNVAAQYRELRIPVTLFVYHFFNASRNWTGSVSTSHGTSAIEQWQAFILIIYLEIATKNAYSRIIFSFCLANFFFETFFFCESSRLTLLTYFCFSVRITSMWQGELMYAEILMKVFSSPIEAHRSKCKQLS